MGFFFTTSASTFPCFQINFIYPKSTYVMTIWLLCCYKMKYLSLLLVLYIYNISGSGCSFFTSVSTGTIESQVF